MSWVTAVEMIPALWMATNILHEAAHCAVVKSFGGVVTEFWPFPGWTKGRFTFAHVEWKVTAITPTERAAIAMAPQLLNTAALIGLCLALHYGGSLWLLGLALAQYVDGATNLATFYRRKPREGTDGWTWQAALQPPVWLTRACAAVWHVSFGVDLARHLIAAV